jgi:hypothetical protein
VSLAFSKRKDEYIPSKHHGWNKDEHHFAAITVATAQIQRRTESRDKSEGQYAFSKL